jgi:histidine ammonia-lyase
MMNTLDIDAQPLSLRQLRRCWEGPVRLTLDAAARARVAAAQAKVAAVVAGGKQVYGLNTGFGQLAQVRIGNDELTHLQENLVRSHAVGVGELLSDDIVRLVMVLKVQALSQGFSGVRVELIESLCALLAHKVYPAIPA